MPAHPLGERRQSATMCIYHPAGAEKVAGIESLLNCIARHTSICICQVILFSTDHSSFSDPHVYNTCNTTDKSLWTTSFVRLLDVFAVASCVSHPGVCDLSLVDMHTCTDHNDCNECTVPIFLQAVTF